MKKVIFLIFFFIFNFFFFTASVSAYDDPDKIGLYFFYGDGCPHCAKEEKFLDKLEKEKTTIEIHRYEVWRNQQNADLLKEIAKKLNLNVSGVPILFIGTENIVGYGSDESTGQDILKAIEYYEQFGCTDIVGQIINKDEQTDCVHDCQDGENCLHDCGCEIKTQEDVSKTSIPETINIPFLGEIKTKYISIPTLTVIIGTIDGFNPCAMWVLLFLISLLLNIQDRKKMWILGIAFILASGFVYFLFLSAWLNLFVFLGFVFWVRFLIASVAFGSGVYHLYDYYLNRDGCKVTGSDKRRKVFEKLKKIVSESHLIVALGGIILLAFAVNLVELVCSAGLPAVYTQILTLSNLPTWQYYGYLFLYILFFMLDDMIVFAIAMTTLKMKAINSKYTKYSTLIGGIIMIIIALLLWLKPGWLMFG